MRTIRMALVGLAVLAFAGAAGAVAHGDQHGDHHGKMKGMHENGATVTLEGEVLDLYCYMKHPANGQGPDHAKCARNCIRKGLPIGYKADGKVYVIVGREHESAADAVADLAGVPSRLTGKLIEHDGVLAIELVSIEKR